MEAKKSVHTLARFFLRALLFAADGGKRTDRGGVQRGPVNRKMRAVTRAIPAPFERIPVHMTTEMGACRRMAVKAAAFIAVSSDLRQALADDRAVAGFQILNRGELSGRNVFREIL